MTMLILADRIHTLAGPRPCSALLIRNGHIAMAGQRDDLRREAGDVSVLDLTGATITPGLVDAHVHLTEWALARRRVDVSPASSPREAAALVAQARRTADDAGHDPPWVLGRGWNAHAWHGAAPHRTILDALVPDTPAALQSHDMHALWVNTAALRLAGVDRDTPDPPAGTIVRDQDGPTGLLLEAAGQLVTRVMPRADPDQVVAAVAEAQTELHSLGIVGVHSFPGIHLRQPPHDLVLRRLRETDSLRLRVLYHIPLDRLDAAIRDGVRSGQGDAWLRVGGVKVFLDGALGSRTAWMAAPCADGSGTGVRVMDPAAFRDVVRQAARAGIAATVHAIGDAAVDLALDVLTDPALRVDAMPHRIEHVQCCPAGRASDAAATGVVCSVQPSHLMTDWRAADRCWGPERAARTFAFGDLIREGAVLAFGSDAPVEPIDPRRGLHAAVHRTDDEGEPVGGWQPAQRIDARAALMGYTAGPARAAGLAAPFGTLAVGAPADLVAWDRDPLSGATPLLELRCVATVIAGNLVYSN